MPTPSNPHKFLRALSATIIFLFGFSSFGSENTSVTQTKSQLKQLDNKINQLKQVLANANDKRGILNQELSDNEKQIGAGIRKLHTMQQDMDAKRKTIFSLEQRVNELNKQLLTQQQLLAEHIRIRYKMGEYQPIKWILNQEAPYSVSRLLTFHQYLVRSRQKIIDENDVYRVALLY